jgi:hypothetical protein
VKPSVDRQFIQTKLIFIANRLEYLKKYSDKKTDEMINPKNLENYGRREA